MLIFLLLLILVLCFLFYNFRVLEICGNSMYPTLKNGEYYLASKVYGDEVYIGEIYALKLPAYIKGEHRYLIKRLVEISHFGKYGLGIESDYALNWVTVLGDNRDASYDSSSFGDIPLECLKYRVLFKIPFIGG